MSGRSSALRKIEGLNFDNLAIKKLPIDSEKKNFTRQVRGACFSLVEPTPVENPKLVVASPSALSLLDLDPAEIKRDDFALYFGGNKLIPGSRPAAHCYCGHQFGYFSGQLGDGATMYLGEIVNSKDERWELQFKGAGLTPYSRTADGRKVLRSSLREFLCSENMHYLNVPTTRAGTVVTSDSKVVRDIFYSGNPIHERCTIITRIAPTFLRFGSFEIVKPTDPTTGRTGPSAGRQDVLTQLLDYTIETFYPEIFAATTEVPKQERYLAFYREVVKRTAKLVAKWQTVGWCHGVLNTDNMSILGVTLDYGPYGFMDRYDPNFICNGSDDGGRYSYKNQPAMCRWNCEKLAEALSLCLPVKLSKAQLEEYYDDEYEKEYNFQMHNKLGFLGPKAEGDAELFKEFFSTMEKTGADFTNSFRGLSHLSELQPKDDEKDDFLIHMLEQCCEAEELVSSVKPSIPPEQLRMIIALSRQNPSILYQLGLSPEALQKEIELAEKAKALSKITPSQKQSTDRESWKKWIKKYRERVAKDYKDVKDKYDSFEKYITARNDQMKKYNPKFVLRNWIAQIAIDKAEMGDFSSVESIFKLLSDPFGQNGESKEKEKDVKAKAEEKKSAIKEAEDEEEEHHAPRSPKQVSVAELQFDGRVPKWAKTLCVT